MTGNEAILLVVAITGWIAFGVIVGVARDTLDLALEIWSHLEFVDDEEKEESDD